MKTSIRFFCTFCLLMLVLCVKGQEKILKKPQSTGFEQLGKTQIEHLRRGIVSLGINGIFPINPYQSRYTHSPYYYSSSYDKDYEKDLYYRYAKDEGQFRERGKISGVSLNMDLMFASKKSCNLDRKSIYGFSMRFEGSIYAINASIEREKEYYEQYEDYNYYYGYTNYYYTYTHSETETTEYSSIAGNFGLLFGIDGIHFLSKNVYFLWGIKPVGASLRAHVSSYIPYVEGVMSGALDLGLGIKISKRCAIEPTVRLKYDTGFGIFPTTLGVQAGLCFRFFSYKEGFTYDNPSINKE